MELIKIKDTDYYYTYVYSGNNRNGNAIYSVNIFKDFGDNIANVTLKCALKVGRKVDKNGSIKLVVYKHQIEEIVKSMI